MCFLHHPVDAFRRWYNGRWLEHSDVAIRAESRVCIFATCSFQKFLQVECSLKKYSFSGSVVFNIRNKYSYFNKQFECIEIVESLPTYQIPSESHQTLALQCD